MRNQKKKKKLISLFYFYFIQYNNNGKNLYHGTKNSFSRNIYDQNTFQHLLYNVIVRYAEDI